MRFQSVVVSLSLVAAAPLAAQRSAVSPFGTAIAEGNANNTIPFWSTSSTYQQVHDFVEMQRLNNNQPMVLNGIAFRVDAGSTAPARTLEVEITVGNTPVTAATATNTFAANFGANPTVVLPFGMLNLPALTSSARPNPPGWIVPWTMPFPWVPAPGNNFVWQWRHRNASVNTWATLDAQDGVNTEVLPNEGQGCIATGQSQPASITQRSFSLFNQTYTNVLSRGAANAASAFFLGFTRTTLTLPGLCAPLQLVPAVTLNGTTSATGQWNVTLTGLPDVRGFPQFTVLGQFAFLDPGITTIPVGLSDMSAIRTPLESASNVTRIWAGPYQGGGGYENAQTSTGLDRSFSLVTILSFP
jgi:hypothetical protein